MTSAVLRYPTHTLEVFLCQRVFRITAVRSVDDLLEQTACAEDIPFWAVLWHSSIGLCEWLCQHRQQIRHKRVIELGTGLGLVGIVARWLGAEVTLNDYQADALEFALWNAAQNRVAGLRPLLADWRHFPTQEPFEIVLGSDILYERQLHPSLYRLLPCLTAPSGRVVIADPWREPAWEFIAEMERLGWSMQFSEYRVPLLETEQDVIVFELHPPAR